MFVLATYFAEDFSKADLYAGPHCFKRCKQAEIVVISETPAPTFNTDYNAHCKTCMRTISFEPSVATKYSGDAAQPLKQINPNNKWKLEELGYRTTCDPDKLTETISCNI